MHAGDPQGQARCATAHGTTSIVPLAALLAGRAAARWRVFDLLATIFGGTLLYLALLRLHPVVIGPDPAAILG